MTDLIVSTGRGLEVWKETNTVFTNLQEGLAPEDRKSQVRQTMAAAIGIDDRLNLVSGELLYEVAMNEYWRDWDFDTFAEYCESELNMRDRKAKYLISIYKKFVIELNLPKEILLDLQWSKAKELISVITEDNWPDLISDLNEMSVKEVKYMVKEMKGGDKLEDSSTSSEDITERVVFNLSKEQAENISTALQLAGTMCGSDKTGNQLDLICSDFLASSAGEGLSGAIDKLDFHIKSLSRTFGVEIKIETVDSERYSELLESEESETTDVESDEVAVS
mgnify:CR=1 FL=1